MLINTFLILFLACLALFLFQIAVQFIKLEHRLQDCSEILEEELIDVFGTSATGTAVPEKTAGKAVDKAVLLMAVSKPAAPKPEAAGKGAVKKGKGK